MRQRRTGPAVQVGRRPATSVADQDRPARAQPDRDQTDEDRFHVSVARLVCPRCPRRASRTRARRCTPTDVKRCRHVHSEHGQQHVAGRSNVRCVPPCAVVADDPARVTETRCAHGSTSCNCPPSPPPGMSHCRYRTLSCVTNSNSRVVSFGCAEKKNTCALLLRYVFIPINISVLSEKKKIHYHTTSYKSYRKSIISRKSPDLDKEMSSSTSSI